MAYIRRGGEFRVNTRTEYTQQAPDVAALSDGGFVVVWEDLVGAFLDPDGYSIKGQLYSSSGARIGGEFLVNTQTTGGQVLPAVTALSSGRFVVTWSDGSGIGDGDLPSVQAQIFDATGGKIGTEFLVNTQTAGQQAYSEIAPLTGGGFVITWSDAADTNIKAQVYDANGTKIGGELTVNTQATGTQDFPDVVALRSGGFLIAWEDDGGRQGYDNIKAQFFDAAGAKIGSELLVKAATVAPLKTPDIAVLTDGRFVVTWEDVSTGDDIKAQLFDSTGVKIGAELLVNTQTASGQQSPSISAQADGGFVITWSDYSKAFADSEIKGQAFDFTGARVGTEFQVNTNTDVTQTQPSIAGLPDGGFIVAWRDYVGDSSGPGISAQMYGLDASGDGSFLAPDGDKSFDGGSGIDTITFRFALTDASVSYVGNTVVVDSASSHTVLTGFERYAFSDGVVNNADGNVLVDDLFYYTQNHDVWNVHVDADTHYDVVGWREGRDPSAFFSTNFYRALNPDVKAAGINPLTHWHQQGWQEGRLPSLDFDGAKYLATNPDVAAAHIDPLLHFLSVGASEGRQPIATPSHVAANGFDAAYYYRQNPDVVAAGIDLYAHFQAIGWKEGRDPNAYFDVSGYLSTYTDVKAAGINPLDHYNAAGWHEGRDPSVAFDTNAYLAANPDVKAAQINPLVHFLAAGADEGRSSQADGVWG